MICSLKFKEEVSYLENVAFDFVLFVLELYPMHRYLTPIMDKNQHWPFIDLFSVQLLQPFSYIRGVLVTNIFSLLLIDRDILAIQQIITHEEHLQYSFWSVAIFWTASERWNHGHNSRKWLKQPKSHFQ